MKMKELDKKKGIDFRHWASLFIGIFIALGGTAFVTQASGSSQYEAPTQAYLDPTPVVSQAQTHSSVRSMKQSETIIGGTTTDDYRCVVVMEPIKPGEKYSEVSEEICGTGYINPMSNRSSSTVYLIARFYKEENYSNLEHEIFGYELCADGFSYGDENMEHRRWSSAKTYSTCDDLTVFDEPDFMGPTYACGPNCPTFYSLNGTTGSWHVYD